MVVGVLAPSRHQKSANTMLTRQLLVSPKPYCVARTLCYSLWTINHSEWSGVSHPLITLLLVGSSFHRDNLWWQILLGHLRTESSTCMTYLLSSILLLAGPREYMRKLKNHNGSWFDGKKIKIEKGLASVLPTFIYIWFAFYSCKGWML